MSYVWTLESTGVETGIGAANNQPEKKIKKWWKQKVVLKKMIVSVYKNEGQIC